MERRLTFLVLHDIKTEGKFQRCYKVSFVMHVKAFVRRSYWRSDVTKLRVLRILRREKG